ncbi:hypothetical protein RN001_010261 [Aquatica leii]|uniref:Cation-transporting ATPase n=1 Tax=Aquatica leii TaxID=1421715 RepID=A0AAN7SQ89_9COLE|nr:hypothetical protein RN001_010261 [Aquatica leii]
MTSDSSQTKPTGDLEFHGYKRNYYRTFITYLFYVITFGLLRLIFCYCPTWRLYATHSKCNLKIAERLLIVDLYQGLYKSYFVKDIKRVFLGSEDKTIPVYLEDGSVKNVQELRVVWCKKLCYVWDEDNNTFLKLVGLDKNFRCSDFYNFNGFSREEQMLRLACYGYNVIDVPVYTVLELFCIEVLTPFYFFQLFSIVVWFCDHYYHYSTAIILMSVFGIITSIIQTRKNQLSLRRTVHSADKVTVNRGWGFEETSSRDLVPGDVIEISKNGCVMQCDAVLISGTLPVPKTPISKTQNVFNIKEDSFHTLFCGTKVIQTRKQDEKVLAIVLRTGFLTSKGELVRSILYPTPTDFKFDQDSYKVIGILTVIAVIGATYTVVSKSTRSIDLSYIIIKALDLITTVIPPALPYAITVGKLHALRRLKKQDIFCINSRVINVSGTVDCMCFDKTGTLTEDGLDLRVVVPVNDKRFVKPIKDAQDLPDDSVLLHGMASCQSLTSINGELVGDPLDVKMFNATNWCLKDSDNLRAVYNGCKVIKVLRQFPFTSNLQRMSVVVKSSLDFEIFCKGSPEMISSLSLPETVPDTLPSTLCFYTRKGYRVIALGYKRLENLQDLDKLERDVVERDFCFIGLLVLENRIKKATPGLIRCLKDANIKTIMITGDNIETALSVAKECGIISLDEVVATVGVDHAYLSNSLNEFTNITQADEELVQINPPKYLYAMTGTSWTAIKQKFPKRLDEFVRHGVVFARMSGKQKRELIEELKKQGYYTGMCGDGANDCGALKASHVGISLSGEDASAASSFTSKIPDFVENFVKMESNEDLGVPKEIQDCAK